MNDYIFFLNKIKIGNFTKVTKKLNTEFQKRFADFKKIQNVVQLLNSSFTFHSDNEWVNEVLFSATRKQILN